MGFCLEYDWLLGLDRTGCRAEGRTVETTVTAFDAKGVREEVARFIYGHCVGEPTAAPVVALPIAGSPSSAAAAATTAGSQATEATSGATAPKLRQAATDLTRTAGGSSRATARGQKRKLPGRACSVCGDDVRVASAMVVDRALVCDSCYANVTGDVERVDVRLGLGEHAKSIVISLASVSDGSKEGEVLGHMRAWEKLRQATCPADHVVIGQRVQVAFPRRWREMNAPDRTEFLQTFAPSMAAHHELYSLLGDAVFRLLDEQKGRAGQMHDDMYNGGVTVEEDVTFYAVEVVYVVGPAPRQGPHHDCVRKKTVQFAVLCTESEDATRYYHFNGNAANFVRSVRENTLGNSAVDEEVFRARLGAAGDLAAVALAQTAPERACVLDRPLWPEGHVLRVGHAWAFGDNNVCHAGPPLKARKVGDGGAACGGETAVRPGPASATPACTSAVLDRCLVVALADREKGAVHDLLPEQVQDVQCLIGLGCDERIRTSVELQRALRGDFMQKIGPTGWACASGRAPADMLLLLNPLSAPDVAATRPASEVQRPSIPASGGRAVNVPECGPIRCSEPPPSGSRPHSLVAVYRPQVPPVFAHGKEYVFKAGSRLAWGHSGNGYEYEAMVITSAGAGGLLLEPLFPDSWSKFRVYQGDVLIILPGFRCEWVVDGQAAYKTYSYFGRDGELTCAGVGEGDEAVTCEKCAEDCWQESYRLTANAARTFGVPLPANAKTADLCAKCHASLDRRTDGAKRCKPARQEYGRNWRAPLDTAVSERLYPP